MRRLLLSIVAGASLAAGAAMPASASARAVPVCHVPGGEVVAYRHGAALVTSNTIVKGSTRSVAYYACLHGVGKIFLVDRGSSAVGPENFAIAGDYLSFVQVGSPTAAGVATMSIEQWNLKTGKRTLNPNTVPGVTYATAAAPPKFTASTKGYLAWVITTGFSLDPSNPGPVNTVTNLMIFDGHAASVADSFNSQTDTAPAGTILSGIFTSISISGKELHWERLGVAKSAPIG